MSFMQRMKGSVTEHFVVNYFDAYQDGTLAQTERAVYEQHLRTCGECRAWVERQEDLAARLQMEMAPAAVLAPAAAARIQQNLYQSMRRAVIMNNVRTSVAAVGALAVLALVVGAVAWWQSSGFGTGIEAPAIGQGPALTLSGQSELDERVIKAIGEGDTADLAAALEEGADPNAESSPGRPALFLAASRGNAEAVRLLIDAGADVNADTADGSILVKAAVEGYPEVVEMLLDAGADIDAMGRAWVQGDAPALWAAVASEHGVIEVARLLIEHGADVDQVDPTTNATPLILAASTNQSDMVELLLESGADINFQSSDGTTALHAAAFNPFGGRSSPEAARVLIEHGAALNITDAQGRTPLDIALPDVAEILREAGAKAGSQQSTQNGQVISAIGEGDVAALEAELKAGADPNAESSPGRPALFLAAGRGNAEAARLLLDAGADVHAQTVDGSILVRAAHEGHREIVEMLLDAGADINATGRSWTPDDSALYAAADRGHTDVATLLVGRGADVNQLNSLGETALMAAASRAYPEIVTLLLENGAQTDIQTTQSTRGYGDPEWPAGATALHMAAYGGYGTPENSLETVRLLIDYGAALNIEDAEGRTPLDVAEPQIAEILREAGLEGGSGQSELNGQVISAIGEGDVAALAAALEAGANPNAESSPGRPALFLASRRGNAEAVRLLIDAGADIEAETAESSILAAAAFEGHVEIIEELLDAGADINATGDAFGRGGSALYNAVVNLQSEAAKLLIERGADVNQPDPELGETPLIPAAARNLPEIVALLLENGADIDHQDNLGRTALHYAAFSKYGGISSPAAAKLLIDHGAALDIEDNEGLTPLDIALPDVAELLREAGAEN
jgi:ankyrin repeat protein